MDLTLGRQKNLKDNDKGENTWHNFNERKLNCSQTAHLLPSSNNYADLLYIL